MQYFYSIALIVALLVSQTLRADDHETNYDGIDLTVLGGMQYELCQLRSGKTLEDADKLVKSAAKEFASRGITVNAVAPGFISTDMTKDLNSESILSAIPLGRFGNPEDVAGAVRFLAADPSAGYITGQTIQVDGGMVMS